MTDILLEVPSLSQSNSIRDQYVKEEPNGYTFTEAVAQDDVTVYLGSERSNVWCGRASASMIYNYFQLVHTYIKSGFESASRSNKRKSKTNGYALIYKVKSQTVGDTTGANRLRIFPMVLLGLVVVLIGCGNAPSDSPTEQSVRVANRSHVIQETNRDKTQPSSVGTRQTTSYIQKLCTGRTEKGGVS